MSEIRAVLTEQHFQRLVAGKSIEVTDLGSGHTLKLILEDLGFDRMEAAIADAKRPDRVSAMVRNFSVMYGKPGDGHGG
jgi:hypothetical protein